MSPWQESHFDRDWSNGVEVTPVHADALVEHQLAYDLLVQQPGETLGEPGCLARRVERLVDVFLRPATAQLPDGVADCLAIDANPFGQVRRQAHEQLGRGLRVGQRTVIGFNLELEEACQVAQLQVGVRICLARQHEGVDIASLLYALGLTEGRLEEADVKADVVTDEEGVTCPLEELARGLIWAG